MSAQQGDQGEVWRIECANETIPVVVHRGTRGFSVTVDGIRMEGMNPREVLVQAAAYKHWPVTSILAPGELSPRELQISTLPVWPVTRPPSIRDIEIHEAEGGVWAILQMREGEFTLTSVSVKMDGVGRVLSSDSTGVSIDRHDAFLREYQGAVWFKLSKKTWESLHAVAT